MELRGCSIEVVERIRAEVQKTIEESQLDLETAFVNAILIDQFLWDYRRENAQILEAEHIPFHKTRSIYY